MTSGNILQKIADPRQFPPSLVSLDLGELFYPNLHELCGLPKFRSGRKVFPVVEFLLGECWENKSL